MGLTANDKHAKDKQNIDTVRNRYNKNGDKWEHFRESKLEKMRAHKANVERRMRASDNLDNRMYWSQRNDKLKRYSRHESLDPSWYTDNIYSNHSIDLEEQPPIHIEEEEEEDDENGEEDDEFGYVDNEKFDRYLDYAIDGADESAFFERKIGRAPHSDVEFNYPKSRSCCFGGGYNQRPKPQLMPKSSSFSVAGRSVCDMRSTRITRHGESIDFGSNAMETNSGYRKFYCWQNGERDRGCDKYGEVKEIYHIDRDRDIYKKSKNDIMMEQQQSNANCIRNIWRRRDHCKNNILNEINGNYQDNYSDYGLNDKYYMNGREKYHGFESHFVEEYLIVPDPMKTRIGDAPLGNHMDYYANAKRHNSLDHHYEPNVKLINDDMDEDNSNLLFDQLIVPPKPRSKMTELEVKAPNRYDDDTSSDSTDLDLDDFNFDFEKYWSELDKTASSSTTNARYDPDYRNNNVNNHNSLLKDKNKIFNYKTRDINLNERTNHADIDDDIDDYKPNILDLLPSPTHTASHSRYLINKSFTNDDNYHHRSRINSSATGDLTKLSPIEDDVPPPSQPHDLYLDTDRSTANTNNNSKNVSGNRNRRNKNRNNTAISLINNIFSIYKPKKYSPVNCRTRTKPDPIMAKNMNVSSTVRPLGAPYNDFMTSIKRPLTITPPRYNGAHSRSATIDQPYFKIIPEKTGLKISPLYRFGYEDDSKLRLKCTARPLLFPL